MLRAIMKVKQAYNNGLLQESFYTIDFESPAVEKQLMRGGMSEDSFEVHEFIGVSIVE